MIIEDIGYYVGFSKIEFFLVWTWGGLVGGLGGLAVAVVPVVDLNRISDAQISAIKP